MRAPGCGAAMVNADARGYYLTEYEPAAVAALARRTPPLTASERISLLGDEWRMVRAGRHDIGTYLDLAAAFANDDTPAVLSDLAGRVGYVASFVADASQQPAFEAWTQARFRPVLDAVGLTGGVGDSDDTNRRRGTLLQLLDSDPTVQQRARALAEGYLANPATLAPTLVGPVLRVAAAGGDAALYDRYMAEDHLGGRSARGLLPLLQRAAGVPPAGAGGAHARTLPCHRRCARRTRQCCWRRSSRRRPRSRRPGRS